MTLGHLPQAHGMGEMAAKPMGGDRQSHRVDTHADLLLHTIEERQQVYLPEMQEHDAVVSLNGLSRFFRATASAVVGYE